MNDRPRRPVRRPAASPEIVFSLLGTAHAVEARLETALAAVGLSLAKIGILIELAGSAEPLALSELADRVACVRSNITQLVDRLEKDGLVRRQSDAADRRSVRAALTAAGRRAHSEGMAVLGQAQGEIVAGLGAGQAANLKSALGLLQL